MKIFVSSKFIVYICIKQHFRHKTRNVTGKVSDKMFLSLKRKLQLEEIRRNYFDPKAAVTLAAHKLEIWPGYVTSIRQHEEQIMLCCEVSCKVLR